MTQLSGARPVREHAKVLGASIVGTVVEYYDFYIYGVAAAMYFGPLFFPGQSPAAQTLLSLLTFGIAFFARPLGAIVFGHFGDRVGRKSTLVASLILMGTCTLAIAFLPTYSQAEYWGAGWMAPAALCLMRFGQGLGLGGEWAGAALLSVEHAPKGWRIRFGATPPIGTMLGHMSAVGVFLALEFVLTPEELRDWGWRLPFLLSAILVAIGLWVRFNIGETPDFKNAREEKVPPRVPIIRIFREHPRAVLAASAAVISPFAMIFMVATYALAQATGPLGYDRTTFLLAQLLAGVFGLAGIFLALMRADQRPPSTSLAFGALAAIFTGLLFGPGLESGSLLIAGATICLAEFVRGIYVAHVPGWMCELFPVQVRYSGTAFAFNFGGILGGAVTPILAQMMSLSGSGSYVGILLSVAGLLSLAGVALAQPAKPKWRAGDAAKVV